MLDIGIYYIPSSNIKVVKDVIAKTVFVLFFCSFIFLFLFIFFLNLASRQSKYKIYLHYTFFVFSVFYYICITLYLCNLKNVHTKK